MQKRGEANPNYRHGLCESKLYYILAVMKNRCLNPKAQYYHRYGGRGIRVCDEWMKDFQSFYDWAMANGYREGLSIDRIDNDGNYCPENCRWTTTMKQANNRSTNHLISHDGKTNTIAEWSRITGIPHGVISSRINRYGWECGKALTTPVKQKKLGGN